MAVPVSLPDARRQLKMEADDSSRDTELQGFISDAAAWVERYTGLLLTDREVTEQFRTPGSFVSLRAWPICPTALLTATYDAGNGPIAIPGVRLDLTSQRARVRPAVGSCWPLTRCDQILSVSVRAGYQEGDFVPGNLRRAMLVLIGAYDADREGGSVFQAAEASARKLCSGFRARGL